MRGEPLWVLASRSGFDQEVEDLAATGGILLVSPSGMFE
jgi:hypothetical protein